MSEPQQIGSSLLSIEANVIIAGLTAVPLCWFIYAVVAGADVWPPSNLGSSWSTAAYAVYALGSLLAVLIVGFVVEALAGLLEEKLVCRLHCYKATESAKQQPQGLIWSSDHAYADFSRRRLRILVARNTAFCISRFTMVLAGIRAFMSEFWTALSVLLTGFVVAALFGYLWIDARKGLKDALGNARS